MATAVPAIPLSDVQIGGAPWRCLGALAVGTVLGAATAKERVIVQGADTLRVRVKTSALAGTATLTVTPILADGDALDKASGTQATTNTVTTASLVNATEASLDYVVTGDRVVDVSVVSGTSLTLAYVDLFLKP